jgi:Tfp pilus assembly protein PilF
MNTSTAQDRLQHARGLYGEGRTGESWNMASPLRPAIDRDGQALRVYAQIAMSAGAIEAAVDGLQQAARLEDDPADVIGGLADLLGTVGQLDEALRYWTLLAAKYPELADAHLNRAVTAAKTGNHELALQAADAGLRRFSGHARLLAVKAMALGQLGRRDESLNAFRQSILADPGRALTHFNRALVLRDAGRFAEACAAFSEAKGLGLAGAQFHATWAGAALAAGDLEDAGRLYRTALGAEPGHLESLKALTAMEFEFGEPGDAFAHFEQSLRDRNHGADAWLDWVAELCANYRYKEAAEVGERARAMHQDQPALDLLIELAKGMSGDAASALKQLAKLPETVAESNAGRLSRAQLALRAGDPALAAALAETAAYQAPNTQMGWALLSLAWRLLDDPREHWLCDYDRLVMVTDVPSPAGDLGPEEFAAVVASALEPLHTSRGAPGNQSLRHGTQTRGHLFNRPEPLIQLLRQAVTTAAEAAIAMLPNGRTHPFLGRKSNRLDFSGSWSVRLKGGEGHHVPHFHNLGWMSSAYYARLPVSDSNAQDAREGWIEFGRPPENFLLSLEPRRVAEPRPGRLVLFPSYLWHGTVPFTHGSRLTAAFDYQPLRASGTL